MAKQQESTFSHPYMYVALEDEEKEQIEQSALASRNFKISSLAIGLLVGFCVQMTTIGANVVIVETLGEDFVNTSRNDIIVFSLVWSFVTSAMAMIALGFLRALVSNFFRSLPIQARMRDTAEILREDMIENMEVLFVIGALVGVSFAWVVTDMFLGMQPHIKFSLTTLGTALLWCKGVLWCRPRGRYEDDDESFDNENEEFGRSSSVTIV